MKKKVFELMMVVVLCLSLTACGDKESEQKTGGTKATETTAEETQAAPETVSEQSVDELTLVESGYHIDESGFGDVYVYYGVKIKNESPDKSAQFPTINVTLRDESGAIISTADQTLFYIYPGDTIAYASLVSSKGAVPANVEISLGKSDFYSAKTDAVSASQLLVSNTSEIAGDYNVSYTGEVENTSSTDISMAAATVLLKKDGAIVYGSTGFIDDLTAGSKKPFEISTYGDLPEHDSYEIIIQCWT